MRVAMMEETKDEIQIHTNPIPYTVTTTNHYHIQETLYGWAGLIFFILGLSVGGFAGYVIGSFS